MNNFVSSVMLIVVMIMTTKILKNYRHINNSPLWFFFIFLFFSWVQSFGHEGLGLLLDILEKLISGQM